MYHRGLYNRHSGIIESETSADWSVKMSYIYIFFFASLFLLGISLGFNLNFKQFNNAIHTYKRKGSAINGSKVRRKMEIDKRVLICISVSRKFYGYHGNQ